MVALGGDGNAIQGELTDRCYCGGHACDGEGVGDVEPNGNGGEEYGGGRVRLRWRATEVSKHGVGGPGSLN
jgi:hypothetical protein